MKYIITFLLLCSITYAGWHHTAYEISQREHIEDVYDCTDKANDFQSICGGKVVYVRLKGNRGLHALNVYDGWVIDCSTGKWHRQGKNLTKTILKHWGEYLPNLVPLHPTDNK